MSRGNSDHHEADRLKQEADFFIETGQVKTLVFDFAGTEFMDSSGIGVIIGRSRKMGYFGGEVYAEHLSGRILKIFKVSGLHTLIRTSVPKQQKEREGRITMHSKNEVELSFDARSVNEGFARMAVAAFITELNPTMDELSDVKTAVSEAVTNAIIHGYDNPEEKVHMTCRIMGREVEIIVCDTGRGIEDVARAMEPFYTTKPELERSGMGFAFMEAFMDEVQVQSAPGKGTSVRMKKYIGVQEG